MMKKALIEKFYKSSIGEAAKSKKDDRSYDLNWATAKAYALVLEDDVDRAYDRVERDIELAVASQKQTSA